MRILVINPNSSVTVTAGIADAIAPLLEGTSAAAECITLTDGPPGIETDAHVADAATRVTARIDQQNADAYIIACFSDPGLAMARALNKGPVYGISESAYRAAAEDGRRFGVISILDGSVHRHLKAIEAQGLLDQCAGDRAIGRGVSALAERESTLTAMIETGARLVEEDGAECLIMGCAGMATYRAAIEDALGVRVIEPCQAAVREVRTA